MLPPVITLKAMKEYASELFDSGEEKATPILKAILDGRSPRLTDIAQTMPGSPLANYKAIKRLLADANPQRALLRLYREEAPFVPSPGSGQAPVEEVIEFLVRDKGERREPVEGKLGYRNGYGKSRKLRVHFRTII